MIHCAIYGSLSKGNSLSQLLESAIPHYNTLTGDPNFCWISNVTLLWLEGSQSLALLLCGLLFIWFAILQIYGKHRQCNADLIRRVEDQTDTNRVEAITNLPKLLPCHFKTQQWISWTRLILCRVEACDLCHSTGCRGCSRYPHRCS